MDNEELARKIYALFDSWLSKMLRFQQVPDAVELIPQIAALLNSSLGDRSGAARKCEFCDAGYAPIGHLYHLLDDGRPNCGNCRCADCMNPLDEFSRTVTPGSGV